MAFIPHAHVVKPAVSAHKLKLMKEQVRIVYGPGTGDETKEGEAHGEAHGEGEVEGEGLPAAAAFAETGTGTLSFERTAPSSAVATEWREDEHFSDIGGFAVSVSHGLDATAMKLEATPKAASEHVFVGVFDDVGLVDAGFNPALELENCAKVVRGALKAEMKMTAEFTAIGDGLELHIIAPVLYFEKHYKLKLVRVQKDATALKLVKALEDFAAAEHQLADARSKLELSKAALKDATADGDAIKQQLAEAKKRIADLSQEIESLKSQLAEAKMETERRRFEFKVAMTKAASDSGANIKELRDANAKAERQLAKAKTQATADRSAADDLRAQIRTRDDCIVKLKSAKAVATVVEKTDTRAKAVISAVEKKSVGTVFDTTTKGTVTIPSDWHVSADGKCATAKMRSAQILISTPLRSDSKVTIELERKCGFVGVGVIDDCNKWLNYGCQFYSDGDVHVNNCLVAYSQAFGGWQSGDRLIVSANLSSGTVSIRAPNGKYSAKWTPRRCSPHWFAVYSNAGTKVRIIDLIC